MKAGEGGNNNPIKRPMGVRMSTLLLLTVALSSEDEPDNGTLIS